MFLNKNLFITNNPINHINIRFFTFFKKLIFFINFFFEKVFFKKKFIFLSPILFKFNKNFLVFLKKISM